MGLSLDAIYAPLNSFFSDHFETDPGSSVAFRFDKFGSVVSDQDFVDPNHPGLGYLPGLAREKFSDLVNHIPIDSADGLNIVLSQDLIDETYYYRLLTPAAPYVPNSADAQTRDSVVSSFGAIKTAANNLWLSIRAESTGLLGEQYRPSLATPENWYDKSKSELWTTQSFQVSEPSSPPDPDKPPDQLWRLKLNSATMQSLLRVDDAQPAPAVQVLRRVVDVPADPRPMTVMRSMVVRPVVSIAEQLVSPAISVAGQPASSPAAPSDFAFHDACLQQYLMLDVGKRLLVSQYVGANAQTQPAQTNSISISFDYCLVRVRRPWYLDAFINDKSWVIPSATKGQLTSSGATGNLPLMPIGFVAIRNLSIEANWTAADTATAADATDFGPFKVSRGIANNKLSHEGLQIIGWLLQKMPDLPPNDSPAPQ